MKCQKCLIKPSKIDQLSDDLYFTIGKYLDRRCQNKFALASKKLYSEFGSNKWKSIVVLSEAQDTIVLGEQENIITFASFLEPHNYSWIKTNSVQHVGIAIYSDGFLKKLEKFARSGKLKSLYPNLKFGNISIHKNFDSMLTPSKQRLLNNIFSAFESVKIGFEYLSIKNRPNDDDDSDDDEDDSDDDDDDDEEDDEEDDEDEDDDEEEEEEDNDDDDDLTIETPESYPATKFFFNTNPSNCVSLSMMTEFYPKILTLANMKHLKEVRIFSKFNTPKSWYTDFYRSLSHLKNLEILETRHNSIDTLETLTEIPKGIKTCKLRMLVTIFNGTPDTERGLRNVIWVPQITDLIIFCEESMQDRGVVITTNSQQEFWRKVRLPNLKTFNNIGGCFCVYRSFSFSLVPKLSLISLRRMELCISTSRDCHSLLLNIDSVPNLEDLTFFWLEISPHLHLALREIKFEAFNRFYLLLELIMSTMVARYPTPGTFGPDNDGDYKDFIGDLFDKAVEYLGDQLGNLTPVKLASIKDMIVNPRKGALAHMEFEEIVLRATMDPIEHTNWFNRHRHDTDNRSELSSLDQNSDTENDDMTGPNFPGIREDNTENETRHRRMERQAVYRYVTPELSSFIQYRNNLYNGMMSEEEKYNELFLTLIWPGLFYDELFQQFLNLRKLKNIRFFGWSYPVCTPGLYRLIKEHTTLQEVSFVTREMSKLKKGNLSLGRKHYSNFSTLTSLPHISLTGIHHYSKYLTTNNVPYWNYIPPQHHDPGDDSRSDNVYLRKEYIINVPIARNDHVPELSKATKKSELNISYMAQSS